MAAVSETKEGSVVVPVVSTLDESGLSVDVVASKGYDDQKPGTSGLRKKTKVFQQPAYLHNFIQACFDCLDAKDVKGSTWVVSGDGRYFSKEATQIIIKIAFANGVSRVLVGIQAIMSTPAVSAVIRSRKAAGGILLTASHNPGGPDNDFGVKLNVGNGGPAPEGITGAVFERTKVIDKYAICSALPDIDLSTEGITKIGDRTVEVFDATVDYTKLLKGVFDFEAIRKLVVRPDFKIIYDGMSGVVGPFAKRILIDELGAPAASLMNCDPKEDFGGGHPDPNLVYAPELVTIVGLTSKGVPSESKEDVPDFGGAADGDADRNMILGARWFVTPSDSLAIIADYADVIPFFKNAGGLKAVSRSMPTSGAIDRVATAKSLKLFEVPTGWKYFGNLMDSKVVFGQEDYTPFLCGEESFGTGSNHIREKDGLWAILAWLSIIASRNVDVPVGGDLVSVRQINLEHWMKYGRNYYSRYDYEGVTSEAGNALMDHLRAKVEAVSTAKKAAADGSYEEKVGEFVLSHADEFEYKDPVTGDVTSRQGIRLYFSDGSRVVFRLSGTGSVGATIRMYLEYYESEKVEDKLIKPVADALAPLVEAALQLSNIKEITGRDAPTVIT